jgi:hypothetical protein
VEANAKAKFGKDSKKYLDQIAYAKTEREHKKAMDKLRA